MGDKQELKTMRMTVLCFAVLVLIYAISSQGTSIYEMVSGAYQVTLVGAFVPLVFGLYWKRATTQGALAAIAVGIGTWLLFLASSLGSEFPAQLAGVLAAAAGMVAGSIMPQKIQMATGSHRQHS